MKLSIFTTLIHLGAVVALPYANNTMTSLQADSIRKVAALRQAMEKPSLPANATEDGLSGPCKPITMIFAKGTGEDGNVGDGNSPGPALFAEMRRIHGPENVTIQGVPYNATVEGFLLGGDSEGSERFLNLTNLAAAKCPDTKLIIGGYSQGAQVAHNAAEKFSPSVTSRVAAGVVFGDPFESRPLGNVSETRVKSICHDGDIICKYIGGAAAHLTYSQDAPEAASFVMTKLVSNLGLARVEKEKPVGLVF